MLAASGIGAKDNLAFAVSVEVLAGEFLVQDDVEPIGAKHGISARVTNRARASLAGVGSGHRWTDGSLISVRKAFRVRAIVITAGEAGYSAVANLGVEGLSEALEDQEGAPTMNSGDNQAVAHGPTPHPLPVPRNQKSPFRMTFSTYASIKCPDSQAFVATFSRYQA
jgi:hypothetical protein